MLRVKLTDNQVKMVMALAVNASCAVGLGLLHFKNKEFTSDEFTIPDHGTCNLDYVEGRMVKLSMARQDDDTWEVGWPNDPRSDYQSWCSTYPTYEILIEAAIAQDLYESNQAQKTEEVSNG